jgi:hypothetical protein
MKYATWAPWAASMKHAAYLAIWCTSRKTPTDAGSPGAWLTPERLRPHMSLLLLSSRRHAVGPVRQGVVRAGNQVIGDDTGVFHPLGLTFFWALHGWKYERERIHEHLKWIQSKGFDYLRILGEVDWDDRSIDPQWPDYAQVLAEFVDTAYDRYGLRSEITMIGGQQTDDDGAIRFVPVDLARLIASTLATRAHKIMLYEMANEADNGSSGYANKVSNADMIDMAIATQTLTVNLISLSRPVDPYSEMKAATATAGATSYTPHPRRSSHDNGWSHVRQGYDFKDFDRAVWNNEPEGPQSSVVSMDNPLQLACSRLLGIMCGGAGYVLHVAQGVTGEADPEHGRPHNMWEVPNIDEIMRAVRACDSLMPLGVENWKCVNNGRDDHPLPLHSHDGFWEGSEGNAPAVNKNYAAIAGSEFVVMLIGVKSVNETGPVPAGTAIRPCHVDAYDPVTLQIVDSRNLAAGEPWELPGRADTMAAYVIRGYYTDVQRKGRGRYI